LIQCRKSGLTKRTPSVPYPLSAAMWRALALVLAYLTYAGYGRRVQAVSGRDQSNSRDGGVASGLRVLSMLLRAFNPPVGWQHAGVVHGPPQVNPDRWHSVVVMRPSDTPATSSGRLLRATHDLAGIPPQHMQLSETWEYGLSRDDRIGPPPDLPSLLFDNRIVYLGMPISASVTELIVSELLYLQSEKPTDPITMYINSAGTTTEEGQLVGFESEAFAIYDTMNYVSTPIETVCVGKAYGLAAMLLANGKKGKRGSMPYGTVMLHQPRGQMAQGQASDIAIKAKEVLYNRKLALDIMATLTGQTIDKLTEDTNRCLYMEPDAAIKYGVIDRMLEEPKKAVKDLASALS